jgi:hypothetical protein
MPRVRGLIEAFEEVLDLGLHLCLLHGLGRLVDIHRHGPLEVRYGARYGVDPVIVDQAVDGIIRVRATSRLTSQGRRAVTLCATLSTRLRA